MKIFSFLKKGKEEDSGDVVLEDKVEENYEEEVSVGTKIKVVAALAVVGLATGVAYWVQEPTDIKADVLNSGSLETQESAQVESEEVSTQEESVVASDVVEVSIMDFAYSPANLTVAPGTTVIWTNMDAVAHTVTGDYFTSDTLNSGDSYVYTFDKSGVYNYFCSIHPKMKGKVTVEGDDPAGSSVLEDADSTEDSSLKLSNDTNTSDLSPTLLTNTSNDSKEAAATSSDSSKTMETVTLNPEELLTEGDKAEVSGTKDEEVILSLTDEKSVHTAAEEESPSELAKSGPEDILYLLFFAGLLLMTKQKYIHKSAE